MALIFGQPILIGDAVWTHLATVHPTVEVARYDDGPSGLPLQVGVE